MLAEMSRDGQTGWERTMNPSLSSPPGADRSTDTPAPRITLAHLKNGQVPLEWHEAVAIVQGLCHAISASGDSVGPAVVNPAAVRSAPTGTVEANLAGPRSAQGAIRGIAQILSDLLPVGSAPVGVTALVWRAMETPPLYSSLVEFSQVLAYFERPNRAKLIAEVY